MLIALDEVRSGECLNSEADFGARGRRFRRRELESPIIMDASKEITSWILRHEVDQHPTPLFSINQKHLPGVGPNLILTSLVEIERIPNSARGELPMSVSSKCYYAIRAVYALAEHGGVEPMKIAEIAQREQIPIRFLEVILGQLKGAGFVQSRRGAEGGYRLARDPGELTVGEIMRFIDGPIAPIDCVSQSRPMECRFHGDCHFFGFWGRVRQAISDVVDQTTFADLLRENRERKCGFVGDWMI